MIQSNPNTNPPQRNDPRLHREGTGGSLNAATSIKDLPFEILLLIFTLIYESECDPNEPEAPLTPIHYLTLMEFPYNLAAVCSTWRTILSTQPLFWRRLILALDSNPKPVASVKTLLEWSKDLPLDFTISRSAVGSDDLVDDCTEALRLGAVRKHIAPQGHRCTRILIKAHHSSSLPWLSGIFGNGDVQAPMLKWLELTAFAGESSVKLSRAPEAVALGCPQLLQLDIDGANFRYYFVNLEPSRTSRLHFPRLTYVTISN